MKLQLELNFSLIVTHVKNLVKHTIPSIFVSYLYRTATIKFIFAWYNYFYRVLKFYRSHTCFQSTDDGLAFCEQTYHVQ